MVVTFAVKVRQSGATEAVGFAVLHIVFIEKLFQNLVSSNSANALAVKLPLGDEQVVRCVSSMDDMALVELPKKDFV